VKVLCLVIVSVDVTKYMPQNLAEMSNMTDLRLSGVFFQALNTPKLAYDAPPNPLVGWGGGHILPIRGDSPSPFPLKSFGVSISAPSAPRLSAPQHKFLATPMNKITRYNRDTIPLSRLAHQAVLVIMYPSFAPHVPPWLEPTDRFSLDAWSLPYGGKAIGILHTATHTLHWQLLTN